MTDRDRWSHLSPLLLPHLSSIGRQNLPLSPRRRLRTNMGHRLSPLESHHTFCESAQGRLDAERCVAESSRGEIRRRNGSSRGYSGCSVLPLLVHVALRIVSVRLLFSCSRVEILTIFADHRNPSRLVPLSRSVQDSDRQPPTQSASPPHSSTPIRIFPFPPRARKFFPNKRRSSMRGPSRRRRLFTVTRAESTIPSRLSVGRSLSIKLSRGERLDWIVFRGR